MLSRHPKQCETVVELQRINDQRFLRLQYLTWPLGGSVHKLWTHHWHIVTLHSETRVCFHPINSSLLFLFFFSVFGLYQRKMSVSLSANCFTLFSRLSLVVSVCCLVVNRQCSVGLMFLPRAVRVDQNSRQTTSWNSIERHKVDRSSSNELRNSLQAHYCEQHLSIHCYHKKKKID